MFSTNYEKRKDIKIAMKKILRGILNKIRRLRIGNCSDAQDDVSIFCNCCIGGAMYHDLRKRFMSPTINLYFAHHHFIDFVLNLKDYLENGHLLDSGRKEPTNNAPIGLLKCQGLPTLEIHFLHYHSFEDAYDKWFSRCKRVNYQKIFLVIEAKDTHEHELLNEYVNLPYNKIIFTNLESDSSKNIMHMNFYDRFKKPITSYTSIFAKKGYDQFDFKKAIFYRDNWEYRNS